MSDDASRADRDTEEYSGSTEEYSGSTEEYPDSPATTDHERPGVAGQQPFWKRAGFDSMLDYIRYAEGEQDRLARQFGEGPLVGALQILEGRAEEPDLELPAGELAEVEVPPARQRRTGQVSVKLKPYELELLREAAGEYGVPPGTLARMFVVRGVQAIAERRRAEEDRRREEQARLRRAIGD